MNTNVTWKSTRCLFPNFILQHRRHCQRLKLNSSPEVKRCLITFVQQEDPAACSVVNSSTSSLRVLWISGSPLGGRKAPQVAAVLSVVHCCGTRAQLFYRLMSAEDAFSLLSMERILIQTLTSLLFKFRS